MRRLHWSMIASGVWLFGAIGWIEGCSASSDDLLTDSKYGTTGTSSGGGGSGGGGGHGGTGGNPPVVCEGDPTMDPMLVDPSCGVFVRADAAMEGNGDPETPHKTLQAAIDKATATGKWVFACTAGEFKESVVIAKGVEVYGGFDCSNAKQWAWKKDTKAKLTGAPNAIPLTVTAAAKKVILDDLAITAAPSALAMKGGSSIAVVLDSVTANLNRCDITAGDATAGVDGEDADPLAPPKPVTTGDNDGKAACTVADGGQATGGAEAVSNCGDGTSSIGGLGGSSTQVSGKAGETGASVPPTSNMGGLGGQGDFLCNGGGSGFPGAEGDPGMAGKAGTGIGTLDSMLGWAGPVGKAGDSGTPGQGGGGGGGKKGGAGICSGAAGFGATGGSGGAGGCGGKAGGGGRSGGSSIALVSINSNNAVVTLSSCKLQAGKGGDGGSGGDAQPGGDGGDAGKGGAGLPPNLPAGCNGGPGGRGGNGGPGGGGAGGHSLAIAYNGLKPVTTKSTLKPGIPGAPGIGGKEIDGVTGMDGDPGMAPADGSLSFP